MVAAASKLAAWDSNEETAVDEGIPHAKEEWRYVQRTIAATPELPPITWRNVHKNINWVSFAVLTVVPALAFYGAATTRLRWQTALWAVLYYFYTGLGITAGYHRLWAHRAYNASKPLQYFLMFGGSGAVEGSIRWWSRGHRAHHRYTDTDLDPYSAQKGFWWSHIGWMVFKGRRSPGQADVSDLTANSVVRWQHRYYFPLIVGMGFIFPTLVAGLGWGDWRGGFFFAGAARLLFVHHSTFCVNSLAHWLGETPFDDKHTPKDHFITALVTIGEGYHNFHHQFPQDYRNATHATGYDPTKWFIWTCMQLGLAYNLKQFPTNEIQKGIYAMELKRAEQRAATISWATPASELPVVTWEQYQEAHKHSDRVLILIAGFVHDVTDFVDEHPGGRGLVKAKAGKDATTSFFGSVYEHSRAAHNLLTMYRVAALKGGYELAATHVDVDRNPNYAINPLLFRAEAAKGLSAAARASIAAVNAAKPKFAF